MVVVVDVADAVEAHAQVDLAQAVVAAEVLVQAVVAVVVRVQVVVVEEAHVQVVVAGEVHVAVADLAAADNLFHDGQGFISRRANR